MPKRKRRGSATIQVEEVPISSAPDPPLAPLQAAGATSSEPPRGEKQQQRRHHKQRGEEPSLNGSHEATAAVATATAESPCLQPEKKGKSKPSWRQDSARCRSCVPREIAGRGRGLVTTRPIRAGQEVCSELPVVHWVYASSRSTTCAFCTRQVMVSADEQIEEEEEEEGEEEGEAAAAAATTRRGRQQTTPKPMPLRCGGPWCVQLRRRRLSESVLLPSSPPPLLPSSPPPSLPPSTRPVCRSARPVLALLAPARLLVDSC
jgi:hypothetical protein